MLLALYPLHSNKGITSSSLDFERIDYKPYTFLRPDFYVFHREIWHNYLKKFLALWNDLVTPACEWFFILSLFHNYGINIHSPEMYSEKNLRDTLKTIYTDLSEYIKKHHVSLMQPAPYDELIPDNDEKPRKISFAVEDIVCKISEHNRMNVLNLSNENDEPVFLDSLITFNKDTLLHKENQQQVITNDQIIRQAYMSLLYGTDLR
jgi:hypothetical protein